MWGNSHRRGGRGGKVTPGRSRGAPRLLLLSAAYALGQVGGEVADGRDGVGGGSGLGDPPDVGGADDHAVGESGDLPGLGAVGDAEADSGRQGGVLADARDHV